MLKVTLKISFCGWIFFDSTKIKVLNLEKDRSESRSQAAQVKTNIKMIIHLSDHLTFWIIILHGRQNKRLIHQSGTSMKENIITFINNCNILSVSCSLIIMNHFTLSKM